MSDTTATEMQYDESSIKVLEGLEGWRLAFSTSTYCLFKNGDREAPFLVKDGKVTPLPSRAPPEKTK